MYLTQLKKSPICRVFKIGVSKKLIKMRKLKKQITKKTELWKKLIIILKKLTGSVWFYKPETKKTEPNRTQIEKTEPNQKNKSNQKNWAKAVLSEKTKPQPVDLNRFRFLKKKLIWLFVFYKN
jgi:hypothetical protein